LVPQPLRHNLE